MPSLQDHEKYEARYAEVLNNPCVSFFTKNIIDQGLGKDPLDAVRYVELALEVLKLKLSTVL